MKIKMVEVIIAKKDRKSEPLLALIDSLPLNGEKVGGGRYTPDKYAMRSKDGGLACDCGACDNAGYCVDC